MSLDLHADVSTLPLWKQALYGLCLVAGVLGLMLFAFMLLVEVWTNPRRPHTWWIILLPAAVSLWHVAREMRAVGSLSVVRWAIFALATLSLAWNAWTLIRDPIGAAFFAAWGVVSSALIFLARLIARAVPPADSLARRAHS